MQKSVTFCFSPSEIRRSCRCARHSRGGEITWRFTALASGLVYRKIIIGDWLPCSAGTLQLASCLFISGFLCKHLLVSSLAKPLPRTPLREILPPSHKSSPSLLLCQLLSRMTPTCASLTCPSSVPTGSGTRLCFTVH